MKLTFLILGLFLCITFAQDLQQKLDYEEWEPLLSYLEVMKWREKVASSRGESLKEPDTNWLKTCSGWTAQELCSTIFGSGLTEEIAYGEDLGYIPREFTTYDIDYEKKTVTAGCTLFNPRNQTYKSIWREGLGCTLVEKLTEEEIRAQNVGNQTPPKPLDPTIPWPEGEGFFPEQAPPEADLECIARVSAGQFADRLSNPRAITVVYKGQLIFEEYAPGITKDNRLIGWSATKSLTQALIGVSVHSGHLNIHEPAPVPEWSEIENDPRKNITIDMMLRMSSGTRWVGDVPPTTKCIFWSDGDCAHTSALKPLVAEPDTLWNYNSGSSYLLSRIALENRGDRQFNNYEWPKQKLFYPIGAHSMYIEYQPNGVYLGGAYGYGTARDWARFGLLYMRDGVWIDGNRILPEGWAEYSGTASHTASFYAAHFWKYPEIDEKMYYASGFRDQNVFIFPDQELVITRHAMPPMVYLKWGKADFLNEMLTCFPKKTTSS